MHGIQMTSTIEGVIAHIAIAKVVSNSDRSAIDASLEQTTQ
jgi:hypothetical protein